MLDKKSNYSSQIEIIRKPDHEKMNTERFHYCDLNEDGFLDIDEFEDYLFPHKSFKIVIIEEKSSRFIRYTFFHYQLSSTSHDYIF